MIGQKEEATELQLHTSDGPKHLRQLYRKSRSLNDSTKMSVRKPGIIRTCGERDRLAHISEVVTLLTATAVVNKVAGKNTWRWRYFPVGLTAGVLTRLSGSVPDTGSWSCVVRCAGKVDCPAIAKGLTDLNHAMCFERSIVRYSKGSQNQFPDASD